MGFHEGASELSGGFLGVDVFFVLSGFLITDLLLTRPGLKDFWARSCTTCHTSPQSGS